MIKRVTHYFWLSGGNKYVVSEWINVMLELKYTLDISGKHFIKKHGEGAGKHRVGGCALEQLYIFP